MHNPQKITKIDTVSKEVNTSRQKIINDLTQEYCKAITKQIAEGHEEARNTLKAECDAICQKPQYTSRSRLKAMTTNADPTVDAAFIAATNRAATDMQTHTRGNSLQQQHSMISNTRKKQTKKPRRGKALVNAWVDPSSQDQDMEDSEKTTSKKS
jgi:hypothetical protein